LKKGDDINVKTKMIRW